MNGRRDIRNWRMMQGEGIVASKIIERKEDDKKGNEVKRNAQRK
jgi:hypothetical protein